MARVRAALATYTPLEEPPLQEAAAPAAVLVALFEEDGETRVVLTRRSANLRSHTGQVAFPGGRVDQAESVEEAALREASEEVGLDPASVEVMARLSRLSTVASGTVITPVVGVLEGRPALTPNPAEVERVFDVALSDLAAEGVHREERWRIRPGTSHPVQFFELEGETVWGATAQVLHELLVTVARPGAAA